MIYIIFFFSGALTVLSLTLATLHESQSPRAAQAGTVAVQQFILYKNAVLAYATANPGFQGTVAATQLSLPAGMSTQSLPSGASNRITTDGAGGYLVYAWAPGDNAELSLINSLTQGDVSVGYTIQGSQWENPELGNMGATPNYVPAGDLLSVVGIGS